MRSAAEQGRSVCCLALQERDAVISKLRRSMSELSFKCEAATAQAEASHPYQQRYTDLQACTTILCALTTCSCELTSRRATHITYNMHTNRPHTWHDEQYQSNGGDAASSEIADGGVCIQAIGSISGSMTDGKADSNAAKLGMYARLRLLCMDKYLGSCTLFCRRS